MAVANSMTDSIRIRIEPQKKAALTRLYESRGTNVSQVVREFLDAELESSLDPLDRLDAIFASADEKLAAYNGPEPTVEDVTAYVDKIRAARARDSGA